MKKNYYLFFAFAFALLSSCKKDKGGIPSYIHIDKFILTTTTGEGSNSHKITDAWVYVDDQLIGAFEIPVTLPVLYEGTHEVMIRPGIKINGIAATRAPYPFYSEYKTTVSLKKGETEYITPSVKYFSFTKFTFMENFDNVGMILANSPSGTDTSMQQIFAANNPNIFEGNGSGIAYLDKNKTFFETVSNTSYVLPKAGAPVFLEMNYKSNHEFVVGMFIHSSSNTQKVAVLNINPSFTWNKTYLYLTPVIAEAGTATDYNIFFGMVNYEGSDSLALLLDNLKLVY